MEGLIRVRFLQQDTRNTVKSSTKKSQLSGSAKNLKAKPVKKAVLKKPASKPLSSKPLSSKPLPMKVSGKPAGAKKPTTKLSATSKPPASARIAVVEKIEEVVVAPVRIEFKVGDKVVYGPHGVGVIDSIEVIKRGSFEIKGYYIVVQSNGARGFVPMGQEHSAGLRRVVDEKTLQQVYLILKDKKVTIDTQTWNRRYREYNQKIKTGSLVEIAKVLRDLLALKGHKELSFGERRMLDTAQDLLVKEISIAKARSEDKIVAELESIWA